MAVDSLVHDIANYSSAYIQSKCGISPTKSLFQVIKESDHCNFNDIEFLKMLGEYDISPQSKLLTTLDVRTGLELIHIAKGGVPAAAITQATSSLWSNKHAPVLLVWKGMLRMWKLAGLSVELTVAEVPTFRGPRDTRALYEKSLESIICLTQKAK